MIIHYHIFKNAGSSVDAMLQASFGDAWQTFDGAHGHDVQSADDVRRALRDRPHLRALSTHLGRPPLPHGGCLPIVFLRHPLLRARSVFEFTRNDTRIPSFADYVRWALESRDGGVVIRDYQVIHLSDASFTRPSILDAAATRQHLKQASRLLTGWGAVGIVEEFDRSAALFQTLYGPKIAGLDLRPTWRNRTTTTAIRPLDEMVEEVRDLLDPHVFNRLVEANRLDLELYEFGRALLSEAEGRLATFNPGPAAGEPTAP